MDLNFDKSQKLVFRIDALRGRHPQILQTCRRVAFEAAPILYATFRFDCSFSRSGIKVLHRQIGPRNLGFIKRLNVDWEELHWIALALQNDGRKQSFQSLEELFAGEWRKVDTHELKSQFSSLSSTFRLCESASEILRLHPSLKVLGQKSEGNLHQGAYPSMKIKWKFANSERRLASDEVPFDPQTLILDIQHVLDRRREWSKRRRDRFRPIIIAHSKAKSHREG